MWGVAKIFTSGHSKGGFDRTPRTPPGYGYDDCLNTFNRTGGMDPCEIAQVSTGPMCCRLGS